MALAASVFLLERLEYLTESSSLFLLLRTHFFFYFLSLQNVLKALECRLLTCPGEHRLREKLKSIHRLNKLTTSNGILVTNFKAHVNNRMLKGFIVKVQLCVSTFSNCPRSRQRCQITLVEFTSLRSRDREARLMVQYSCDVDLTNLYPAKRHTFFHDLYQIKANVPTYNNRIPLNTSFMSAPSSKKGTTVLVGTFPTNLKPHSFKGLLFTPRPSKLAKAV